MNAFCGASADDAGAQDRTAGVERVVALSLLASMASTMRADARATQQPIVIERALGLTRRATGGRQTALPG